MVAKPPPVIQHPAKFRGHKSCESEGKICWSCHMTSHWSRDQMGHIAFRMWASHGKSALCLVWYPCVFCKWRYKLLNLLHDLIRPPHWGVMQIYVWELLAICQHPDKFCDHWHSDRKYIFNLSHDLTWPYVWKVMWIYGWIMVSHYLAIVLQIKVFQLTSNCNADL